MARAESIISTTRPTEAALHDQLRAAGMRLQRLDNDRYAIIWRRQEVCRGLSLQAAAKFIDRALVR
jgi:hypothetical protein